MVDASTALGHPGAGHHFMLVLSWTKLLVIKCWNFCFTLGLRRSSLDREEEREREREREEREREQCQRMMP